MSGHTKVYGICENKCMVEVIASNYFVSQTMVFTPDSNGYFTWQHNKNHKYVNISITPQSTLCFCQYDWDYSDNNNAVFKLLNSDGSARTLSTRVGILAFN